MTTPTRTTDDPTPVVILPFTHSFDFEDDHCTVDADVALSDFLNEATATRIRAAAGDRVDDDDHVRSLLLAEADELEAGDADAQVIDEVREAAARLTYCDYSCTCAIDDWDHYKDWFDETLAQFGKRVWSVTEPIWRGDPEIVDDHDGELTVDDLLARHSRRSWSSLTLDWDGTRLEVAVSGRDGSLTLEMVPLTADQVHLRERWAEFASYDTCLATRVRNAAPLALTAALALIEKLGYPDALDFDDLLAGLTGLAEDELAALDVEVFTALYEDWAGTMPELVRAILAATTPALVA